jgi:hypothetical protein
MPEITPRRRGELVRGVFKILLSHPDGLPAKTILERLQGETKCKIQSCIPPRKSGLLVYSSMVSFNV